MNRLISRMWRTAKRPGSQRPARFAAAVSAFVVFGATHSPCASPANIARTPLYFEANNGQVEGPTRFVARGSDCTVSLAPAHATIVVTMGGHSPAAPSPVSGTQPGEDQTIEARTIRLSLQHANPRAGMKGLDPLPARANYFVGNDPAEWRANIPLFSRVQVDEVYPGIRLVYHADESARLEYDFIVQPHARPESISFRVEGADNLSVDASGNLVLKIGSEEIREHRPVIYQNVGGVRKEIAGGYHVAADSTVSFRVGEYDRALPLVIDPVLSFSTYLGKSKIDIGWGVAADSGGNLYVAGETLSAKLATTNAFQPKYQGGTRIFGDAFVAKYDSSGSNLLFLTYLGGKRDDGALGIAVDPSDYPYITGFTDSPNFPVTNCLIHTAITGRSNNAVHVAPVDAFVTKLNTDGASLIFSTYIGGDKVDEAIGIAVDAASVYIAGLTQSTNFVPAPNGYQTNFGGNTDAFVLKFNNDGTTNSYYCTYLGGTNVEFAESIAIDGGGSAYVAGFTSSTNFPVANPITFNGVAFTNLNGRTNLSTATDAFISRLSNDGASLIFSTYLGGTNNDAALRVAVDGGGNAYATGYTFSTNFPVTGALPQATNAVKFTSHAFLTKVDPGGTLLYSTHFGGNGTDQGIGLAVDSANNAFVVGSTTSTNFFTTNTSGFFSPTNSSVKKFGTMDGFIAEVDPTGSNFVFSAYFGGPGQDQINAITLDPAGTTAYIVGQTTSSTNFPLVNPRQTLLNGMKKGKIIDAFVGKVQLP